MAAGHSCGTLDTVDWQGCVASSPNQYGASLTHGMRALGEQSRFVHSDPDIMSGTPVFIGTRVPLQSLIDYLEGGETIDEFLDGFPTVSREQVIGFLRQGRDLVIATL